MDEPIINPWIFYWMSVVDNLRSLLAFIGAVTFTITLWLCLDWIVEFCSNRCKNDSAKIQKIKSIACIGLVCSLLFTFIPSEKTLTRMIVASYVTPQNIEIMQGEANKSVDYLINKIIETGEKWEQRGKDD